MMALPEHISTKPKSFDRELRSNLDAIRPHDEWYRVVGGEDDEGAVIVSQLPEPVDFAASLTDRVANFVPVDGIGDVLRFVDAYTQTVGVYPEALKAEIRDTIPLYGAQRLVTLGYACTGSVGDPQDSIEPVRRMAKWIVDENALACEPVFNHPTWTEAEAVPSTVGAPTVDTR
jgi:hypothetical protein